MPKQDLTKTAGLIKKLPVPYNKNERDVLTTAEAAEILNVSKRTILNMIDRKTIYAYKLDPKSKSVYCIPADEVQRVLREREKAGTGRKAIR